MEVTFFDNANTERRAIFRAVLPLVPRIGESVELPNTPPSHPGWIVADVVWDFKHAPHSIAVYLDALD